MPKPVSDTINADEDPDGVSAALGLDDAEADDDEVEQDDDADGGDTDDDEGDDEPTLADVLAQLAEQRRTIAQLKREAAAARVASKGKAKPEGETADETPEQAAERGRQEARLELGLERAGDRIRAALTGIIPETDLDDFVDDLKLERYVDEDGKPDTDAIKALRDRQAKITRRRTPARVGHARQGGAPAAKSKGELLDETLTRLNL